jgi:endonuclease-8
VGRQVISASGRRPGPRTDLLTGALVTAVDSQGKNLLIRFSNGLELRTHLGLRGSWHRYRPGEPWRRSKARARLVLEVPGSVAVCFDAPVIELFEERAEAVHPVLTKLGPDLLDADADLGEAVRRLRAPARASMTIAEALLDQRALAGIGNIWKNETLFAEGVNPFVSVGALDDATLARLVRTARRLLAESAAGRSSRVMAVYRRAGRPCRVCGTIVRATRHGGDLPRATYWCPTCQEDRR